LCALCWSRAACHCSPFTGTYGLLRDACHCSAFTAAYGAPRPCLPLLCLSLLSASSTASTRVCSICCCCCWQLLTWSYCAAGTFFTWLRVTAVHHPVVLQQLLSSGAIHRVLHQHKPTATCSTVSASCCACQLPHLKTMLHDALCSCQAPLNVLVHTWTVSTASHLFKRSCYKRLDCRAEPPRAVAAGGT